MNSRAFAYRKVLHLLLAFAFLSATGPDVYGVHGCPYHDSSEAEATASHDHSDAPPHTQHHDAPDSDQPCTWLVDCHASVESSSYLPPAKQHIAVPKAEEFTLSADARAQLRGPRHLLYELHLPNAPPLSI